MKKVFSTIILLFCISGCVSTNNSINKVAGQGHLIGKNSDSLRVLIRKIDNGDILWAGTYKLATNAPITKGTHKVFAMCEFNYSWGQQLIPGEFQLNVKPDTVYHLNGSKSKDGERCNITVNT